MGRAAFSRFLIAREEPAHSAETGVTWGEEITTWDELLDRSRKLMGAIKEQHAYVVDPTAGMDSLPSLLAVAQVPDTVLLWSSRESLGLSGMEIAGGLDEVDNPLPEPINRPSWGVCTSGSSGKPKVAVGHADLWELIVLHYERAIYGGLFTDNRPPVIATSLPLQFSAAFFMAVLPGLFFRRDLVIFPPHDWSSVIRLAQERNVIVLSVPAIAAAACLGAIEPVPMDRVVLFLGGGHVSAERVALIRERFPGAAIANLYGTAETGAVAVDHDPGHNRHVGRPVPGKAVWIEGQDERGIGVVAAAGPDCCQYVWRPGEEVVPNGGYVASTDYGRFDDHGRLCLEGRIDGGEKLMGVVIYPRRIERHLLALVGVVDARVVVRRDPSGLEHLAARVVGDVREEDVRWQCAQLPEIERPRQIKIIPQHEALSAYTANGKL
jgi:acyl-coenzyme A synthetase/AMP-(fatty) acid ligase